MAKVFTVVLGVAIGCSEGPTHVNGAVIGALCKVSSDCASADVTRCCYEATCGGLVRQEPGSGVCVYACSPSNMCSKDTDCPATQHCCISGGVGCRVADGLPDDNNCMCVAN